jgi:putative peptide zinc metalloprotease protein
VLAVVCLIPVPEHFRAPGMVEAGQFDRIFAQGAGVVESVDVKSGSVVKKGQVIARLRNAELMLELDAARSGQAQTLAEKEKALDQSPEELEPLNLRMDADKKEIARLEGQIAALVITSPADGVWFSRVLENAKGEWVLRGEEIGDLVQAGAWNFRAVVPQSHSRALFAEELRTAEVRLPGAGGVRIPVQSFHVIPAKQEILPTAALGWRGGGPVEVDAHEADGKHAAEPCFEVRAVLADGEDALLREGRTGFIRFALPPRPLAVQLWRRAGQLLQERSAW